MNPTPRWLHRRLVFGSWVEHCSLADRAEQSWLLRRTLLTLRCIPLCVRCCSRLSDAPLRRSVMCTQTSVGEEHSCLSVPQISYIRNRATTIISHPAASSKSPGFVAACACTLIHALARPVISKLRNRPSQIRASQGQLQRKGSVPLHHQHTCGSVHSQPQQPNSLDIGVLTPLPNLTSLGVSGTT